MKVGVPRSPPWLSHATGPVVPGHDFHQVAVRVRAGVLEVLGPGRLDRFLTAPQLDEDFTLELGKFVAGRRTVLRLLVQLDAAVDPGEALTRRPGHPSDIQSFDRRGDSSRREPVVSPSDVPKQRAAAGATRMVISVSIASDRPTDRRHPGREGVVHPRFVAGGRHPRMATASNHQRHTDISGSASPFP